MWLKKVKSNLDKRKYKRSDEFFEDIQLIWQNCMTYNIEDSLIYKTAKIMEEHTIELIKKYKEHINSGTFIKKKRMRKINETTMKKKKPNEDEQW